MIVNCNAGYWLATMGARETGVFGKMSVLYLFALLCAFAGVLTCPRFMYV